MSNYQIKPIQFFIPLVLGLIGGYIKHNGGEVGYYLPAFGAAGACIVWMFYYVARETQANIIAWEVRRMELFLTMTPDERVEYGYKIASSRMEITQHIQDQNGYETTTKFDWLPWSEGKFEVWALAMMRGSSPRFRDWEGTGRLFKDGEYEKGVAKLIELGYLVKDGEAVNSKTVLTDAGIKALSQYLNSLGKYYEILPEYAERIK